MCTSGIELWFLTKAFFKVLSEVEKKNKGLVFSRLSSNNDGSQQKFWGWIRQVRELEANGEACGGRLLWFKGWTLLGAQKRSFAGLGRVAKPDLPHWILGQRSDYGSWVQNHLIWAAAFLQPSVQVVERPALVSGSEVPSLHGRRLQGRWRTEQFGHRGRSEALLSGSMVLTRNVHIPQTMVRCILCTWDVNLIKIQHRLCFKNVWTFLGSQQQGQFPTGTA